jgi:3-hydroxyacyl-[acyl-carrier-protein] dehydratase
MEQLQGILLFDPDQGLVVGYKDVRRDEFWTSGHMPGRPLFPGVLMIEAAAQLCTFFYRTRIEESRDRQYGFGALDRVRFRGTVKPGDRLLLVAKVRQLRKKFFFFDTQAFVGTRLVYEGEITGIELPSNGDTTA